MDAGLLGPFQVGIAAGLRPAPGLTVVVKSDGAQGACGITRLTRFRARSILAEQAACGLFLDV